MGSEDEVATVATGKDGSADRPGSVRSLQVHSTVSINVPVNDE
jgi:hypothetical protein